MWWTTRRKQEPFSVGDMHNEHCNDIDSLHAKENHNAKFAPNALKIIFAFCSVVDMYAGYCGYHSCTFINEGVKFGDVK